jgi:hypothetical protein
MALELSYSCFTWLGASRIYLANIFLKPNEADEEMTEIAGQSMRATLCINAKRRRP